MTTDPIETKYFVQAFLRFLQNQIDKCNFSPDIVESLEVAAQCLETAYDLPSLNNGGSGSSHGNSTSGDDAAPSTTDTDNPLNYIDLYEIYQNTCCTISSDRKQDAENIKNEGNQLMKEEKYSEALSAYNRAISIDATNPVFYCNRAAAYSRLGDYQRAADDCKMALRYDANYSKAYGRLGMAYAKMNKNQEAEEAYKNALRLDPDNADYKNNLTVTQQRIQEAVNAAPTDGLPPNFADMGGFNFNAALNNPALMNLATQMMSDPAMQDTISQLRNQLSGMNNMNGIFEIGRQLVGQMRNQNPEMFDAASVAFAQANLGGGGGGENGGGGGESSGSENPHPNTEGPKNPDQPPPPPPSS